MGILPGATMHKIISINFVILCLFLNAFPQTDTGLNENQAEIVLLKKEVRQLRIELDSVKAEVERLRAVISTSGAKKPSFENKSANTESTSGDTSYWITKGGKRHNSTCKYYKKTKGRPCGPSEGVPCKLCGG